MKEFIISQSFDVLLAGFYFIVWGLAYGFKNTVIRIFNMFSNKTGRQNFIGTIGDSLFYFSVIWLIISFI